jgi:hypothetical protein
MKKLLLVSIALITVTFINAQQAPVYKSVPMSRYDSLKLAALPELKLSAEASRRLLPTVVDNSTLPFLRPVLQQYTYECGQSASIGYVFTYEMNCFRNLPADVPENQYTTHFAYNFINGGGEVGVSYYETYEILKQVGCPTIAEYGGMAEGGETRWMSGYDHYYNAMQNRVADVWSVKVGTEEGIQTLKNWLYDHGNSSQYGGVGCFYSELAGPQSLLPVNTPEAGKQVITTWGPGATHAMTIVGYHDSIRYDYNGDGLYTNHLDINNDGVVNVQDWEIGGFKMVNSYNIWWGNEGFAYMMYKSVADEFGRGGIWNNTVVVIDVKETHLPQLTAKLNLSHTCRNKLGITAGVSLDTAATEPDYIIRFPAFDFQGGCLGMEGNEGDTIEIGLDLNLLLHHVQPGNAARYFIMVKELDEPGTSEGTLHSFSLFDYTNGVTEITTGVNNLPVTNHAVTTLSAVASPAFSPVAVTTSSLPVLPLYEDYSYQLQASGGTPPYRWHPVEGYTSHEHDSATILTTTNETKLILPSNFNGRARVVLPFPFSFYGKEYTEVYATVDGFLMFLDTDVPWPYFIEGRTYFIENPVIAPALCNPLMINSLTDGIWYAETNDYVTFRWQMSVYGAPGASLKAMVRLYADGNIDINYQNTVLPSWVERYAGISAGDGENYELLSYQGHFVPENGQLITYVPHNSYASGLVLSPDGLLSGQCYHPVTGNQLTVGVSDQNNIRAFRTFQLTSTGLQMECMFLTDDDHKIEFGESVTALLTVANHNNFTVGPSTITLNNTDPYYTLTDSVANIPALQPGYVFTMNAYEFTAGTNLPNIHQSLMSLQAASPEGAWQRNLNLTGYRPVTVLKGYTVTDDNNQYPEPGEVLNLQVTLANSGGCELVDASTLLQSVDPYVTILTGTSVYDTLKPGGVWTVDYMISLSPDAPTGHTIILTHMVNGHNEYTDTATITFRAGIVVETFESNDLQWLAWDFGGAAPWFIEEGYAMQGNYCIRSGNIGNSRSSILVKYWDVEFADSVSFWYKMDSQYTYDFMKFNIGTTEKGRWSGNTGWQRAAYAVSAGPTKFTWTYTKNSYGSEGEDCARLDYIVFPPLNGTISAGQSVYSNLQLNIYPNPGSSEITVTCYTVLPGKAVLSIYNMHGHTVYTNQFNAQADDTYTLKPNLGALKPGIYIVRLETEQGVVVRKMEKM